MKERNTTYVIIAVIAIIVGFILGAWWKGASTKESVGLSQSENIAVSTSTTENTTLTVKTDTVDVGLLPSMMVSSQSAGSKVIVSAIKVPYTSWVVITEDSQGSPARILGARRVATTDTKTEVTLLRPTIKGNTYHAIVYKDNGDGAFDHKIDTAVEDTSGKNIETLFKAI